MILLISIFRYNIVEYINHNEGYVLYYNQISK